MGLVGSVFVCVAIVCWESCPEASGGIERSREVYAITLQKKNK